MPTPYNRTVKENTFTSIPDGSYEVNGIADFFSLDDRNLPVFVPQGDQIVARFHLSLTPEELKKQADAGVEITQGPAMSADHQHLLLLARAFGVDVKGLPEGDTTTFLVELQNRINAAGKKQTVKVNGGQGWAKYMTGTNPDTSVMYLWAFSGFASEDKSTPVRFQTVSFPGKKPGTSYSQSVVYAWFKLVGDMYGRPTPFDGFSLRMKVVNPFEGEVQKIAAERWDRFVKLYCPSTDNWDWIEDPERSVYGVNETANPIVVFEGEAKKAGRKALAQFKTNDHGVPKMDIMDFAPFDPPIDLDQRKVEESSQPRELADLVELIDHICAEKTGSKAFEPTAKDANVINLKLTDAGTVWAKENLVPAWDSAKLPLFDSRRVIGKLSGAECGMLEKVLRETFNKPKLNVALTEEGSF
jgi:hypothetical protein